MSFDYEDWLEERQKKADAEHEAKELDYELENPDLDDWENKDVRTK